MLERLPDEISVDTIKRCFKIDKVYIQGYVTVCTVINNGAKRINLIDAGSVSAEPTLVIAQ